jgi:hypothetical protein
MCAADRKEDRAMEPMLDAIERSVRRIPAFLETIRRPDPPYGRYRYYADSPKAWCLYASIEGVATESFLGLTDRWPAERRREVSELWQGCQGPDGYFYCPCCSDRDGDPRQRCDLSGNPDGIAFKVAMSLHALAAAPRFPLPTGRENEADKLTPESVDGWLRGVFERNNPYSAGSRVWKACGARCLHHLLNGREPMADPIVARFMEWLIEHQDPDTGLWFHQGDLMNGVNGLLKMRFGTFDLTGIAIPRPERIVASILSIQKGDGSFGGGCADWNAVGLLAEIGRRAPERREAIVAAFRRAVPVFLAKQRDPGGYGWGHGGAEDVAWLKATFVNLNGLLAIRSFLLRDDACLNQIFPNNALRERLLDGGDHKNPVRHAAVGVGKDAVAC